MVKPIFNKKRKSRNSIILVKGTKIIQEKGELAKTYNVFFVSIVKNLGINENLLPMPSSKTRIIVNLENQPIIVTIHNRFDKNTIISFKKMLKLR